MLELTNDKDGVLLCFVRLGCLCVFMGCMWGVVVAGSLCCIGKSHVKDWVSNSPTSYYCVQICVIANKISKINFFSCIHCAYPLVSLILTTCKSISGQGRKMNMNSYPA